MDPSILIVDDDEALRALLERALRGEPSREIVLAASATEARAALAERRFDVVITDLSMPGEGGLSLMRWSQEQSPGAATTWIVLTGHGTFDAAVEALQLGASDFFSKPLRSLEPLRNAVGKALEHQRLLADRDRLHGELQETNERLRDHVDQLEEACRLLRQQADTIQADLHRAGIIQQALLPHSAPHLEDFHVRALYRPSQNVGGDLYDVARLDDRHVVLLVADAAGHGLSAAMLAVLFRSQLPLVDPDTRAPRNPSDVLRAVNRSLCDAFSAPGLFLTAAYCLLDTERREATIASAGHPPVLWSRRRGGIEHIFHTGPALGLSPRSDFTQKRIALEPGDDLLFYSDGLYERFPDDIRNPSGAIAAALEEHMLGNHAHPEDPQTGARALESLLGPLLTRDAEDELPRDDVTVLMLEAAPGTSVLDNGAPPPITAREVRENEIQTLVGADSRHVVLSIQGRGDWNHSAPFQTECAAAIGEGRDVMVDLTLCRRLDSTFLGTIHQLCELADEVDVEFRLQGVTPPVEDLFVELGMENVMDHIVPRMLPLPTKMKPVDGAEPDPSAHALALLRAHEGLAALNDRNRQEFDPLLTQLRQEIAALSR